MTDVQTIQRKPPGRKTKPERGDKKYGRSTITNGSLVLDVDGRSGIFRRYRDIASAILAEAGADKCGEARKQLIRRFAAASVLSEQLEVRISKGEQVSITEVAQLSSTLVRLTTKIGINPVVKDGPTLNQYLEGLVEEREP